ncbi:hypothetical protein IQ07DRAFT_565396 [Pyrenochaeta sp. DS3sAY3a]|nr:hypothetical protein IQ07DRAFT_565396 [Pyrenochaeta sp. DS3sAY3a]
MEYLHISELEPGLPTLASKHIRAAVTLIWPYSSSARQFALLLGEPDFRLRRKKGQVRARFSGSSARAIATTGVGIGDEVILSLRGAQFVQDGAASTPGKSIDWELSYTQTVAIQVFRGGREIASLDLVDVAPTPAPRSPVRREPDALDSPARKWSSPAFLKRARLSDGPVFEAPYDPLFEEPDTRDSKRRRKSYRDWKAWTYSARTPSPEKENSHEEEDFESLEASPSRMQLPDTPVSPPKPNGTSASEGSFNRIGMKGRAGQGPGAVAKSPVANEKQETSRNSDTLPSKSNRDNLVRDADYYELYAGPDEFPPDSQYAFGGDTEVDTEVNTEEEEPTQDGHDIVSLSTTEANTEDQDDDKSDDARSGPTGDASQRIVQEHDPEDDVSLSAEDFPREMTEASSRLNDRPTIVMPPPILPTLNTDFPSLPTSGLLTPIGRAPASPTLKPLDSATLPLPSPFPGERDSNIPSYLDHVSSSQQPIEPETGSDPEAQDDAEYIMETSFFSSINSSTASALHPDHESVLTPVRFSFGFDGAYFSRVTERSSPAPHNNSSVVGEGIQLNTEELAGEKNVTTNTDAQTSVKDFPESTAADIHSQLNKEHPETSPVGVSTLAKHSDAIELSSGSESESSDESEEEEDEEQLDNEDASGRKSPDHTAFVEGARGISVEKAYETTIENDSAITSTYLHEEIEVEDQNTLQSVGIETLSQPSSMDTGLEALHTRTVLDDTLLQWPSQHGARAEVHDIDESSLPLDDQASQLGPNISHGDLQDAQLPSEPLQAAEWESLYVDQHTDIKMESIEEVSMFNFDHVSGEAITQPAAKEAEVVVSGSLVDNEFEQATIDPIPPMTPTRNTRSKAKTSEQTSRDEIHVPKRTTRSTRSKASITSIDLTTVSPRRTRTRSTVSPSRDATPTSPYSLRSQSKLLSPKAADPLSNTPIRRSPRKHASHRSIDSISSIIQDSIESHNAGQDASTVPHSDPDVDMQQFVNFSDSVEPDQHDDFTHLKPPPANAAQMSTRARTRSAEKSSSPALVVSTDERGSSRRRSLRSSGPVEAPLAEVSQMKNPSSPRRSLRSSGSAEPQSPKLQATRRSKRNIHRFSPEGPVTRKESSDKIARKTAELSTSPPPNEQPVEDSELRSSPPQSSHIDQVVQGVPRTTRSHTAKQQSMTESNMPMTPEATQLTTVDSQASITNANQQQTLPMTPQLTQATSNGIPMDVESDSAPESPIIGLSTPISYYTPLKDLIYFLNRSSDFHSSSNPDVLALVTSSTTPSERAKKGPKHWNTTLHVTDASTWPATTTVQVFRASQTALPRAHIGDIILLRAFGVKSLNRHPSLLSADESSWCVWNFNKPVWGAKKGAFAELKAREEVNGPPVERGEGEYRQVERLHKWFVGKVRQELEENAVTHIMTRLRDKREAREKAVLGKDKASEVPEKVLEQRVTRRMEKEGETEDVPEQRVTRSKDKAAVEEKNESKNGGEGKEEVKRQTRSRKGKNVLSDEGQP